MRKVCLPLILLAGFLLIVSSGFAETLNISPGDEVNARLNGSLVVPKVGGITLSIGGETYGDSSADHNIGSDAVWAGCYRFDIENMVTNYKSFCMDALADVTLSYTLHTAYAATTDMESIWGTYYDGVVDDSIKSAALQLAMWELVHETGATYDITAGNFQLSSLNVNSSNNNGATYAGLVNLANGYLDSSNWTGSADLILLDDGTYQPFLVEVPEPSTITLLVGLLTIGSMGLLRRK
jgi:hypothetical protein